MNLNGQKIAILGAGKSGLGAARLALKLGAVPVVFDDGDPKKLEKAVSDFQLEGIKSVIGLEEAGQACLSTRFDLAVVSPGLDASWPLPRLFVNVGVPLIGELEFAWRELKDIPVVAITGTNGKTTTTELLERVFKGCGKRTIACGNYGLALSEVACSDEKYDMLMVEVSSFQLETISSFHPKVALWLNFAPDHLDRYPNNEAYFAAKRRIFDYMESDDLTVIRAGESFQVSTRKLTFSTEGEVKADFELRDNAIWFRDVRLAAVSELPLQERHNIENEMAVLAAGWSLGLKFEEMLVALAGYEPARHRCELVRILNGRRYINDSKATNLHALETCLKSQDEPVVLIAGGKEKGLDYHPFKPLLTEKVGAMVAIGEIADKLCDLFSDIVPCHKAGSVEDAVTLATTLANPNQSIVFSPGTSSFDMFSGYVERGNVFRAAVMALPDAN
ncbi:UDP-N-acetylmuramoyl-L-alanine--D-glutamate ligase [soil metagenome]